MTPLKPSLETFRELAEEGNLIPVYTELAADYETPVSAFQKLSDGGPGFLFESAEKSDAIGRYSFLGTAPKLVLEARGREISITEGGQRREENLDPEAGDPLHRLEALMAPYQPVEVDGLPVFSGGAVGYLAYDMVRFFEPTVSEQPSDDLGVPDLLFLLSDTVVIFDHRHRRMQVVANVFLEEGADLEAAYADARGRIDAIVERLAKPLDIAPMVLLGDPEAPSPRSNTTQEEYESMVSRAKEYIHAGDIFQVVPSQRFEVDFPGRPLDLYRALRHVNPSPYMFLLNCGDDLTLVGSSPEVHVRSIEGKIEIRPLAGTRPRGATPEEDKALADDLLGDPKELAEHVMLVDLARNDVGRVAKFESVKVTDFEIIERYSHVMHIVSNVEGRLSPEHSAYDVMRATFPAGTVSGSPKVRAMQIIDELEKNRRGAYAGAVGYFGYDGNHDSCIALRTVVLRGGKAYVQAGAGVVADSVPEREYQETVNKAMGMIRAIARARQLGDAPSGDESTET